MMRRKRRSSALLLVGNLVVCHIRLRLPTAVRLEQLAPTASKYFVAPAL